jgi:hypothetical protein
MAIELVNETINGTATIVNATTNNTFNLTDAVNNTLMFIDKTTSSIHAPIPTWLIISFIGIVALVFVFTLLIKGINLAIALAINSVIGFFALYAVQLFLLPSLVINIWSVAIVAILGLAGFILVLLLHGLGMFF